MENFNFYSPTEFVFGKDTENDCGKYVKDAIQKGGIATAEKYYRDAENASKELLGKFRQMKEIAMKR